jgi:hypothetical protein
MVMSLRRVLLTILASCMLLLGLVAPAASAEEDPFLTDAAPPRVVQVDAPPGEVTLFDEQGVEIPLTGVGTKQAEGSISLYPPRLPSGVYTIRHTGGEMTLTVGSPQELDRITTTAVPQGNRWLPWLLVVIPLGPAVLLLARRRWRAGSLALVASITVAGLLTLAGSDAPRGVLVQGDPCVGVESAQIRGCATGYVLDVLATHGPLPASQELTRLAAQPASQWAPVCHEVAHELGTRTWLLTRSVDETIAAGSTDCSLGYVHGLLEVLGTYLDDETFPAAAKKACDGLDDLYRTGRLADQAGSGPASLLGCHHGAGHAAMWRFNEDLTKALPVCAGFDQAPQQEECRVGAVMEWVYADQRAQASGRDADRPQPQVTQPVELCMPPLGVLSSGCIEGAITAVTATDIEATRQWCVEHPDVLGACVQSLARRMVQIELSQKIPVLQDVASFCSSLGGAFLAAECADRFGYMLLFLSRDMNRTQEFCDRLPDDQRAGCRRGVATVLEYAEKVGDSSFNLTPSNTPANAP